MRSQSHDAQEIVVVVDHNDELLEWARERWPDLVAVPNEEARGLSGARNTGVARATGDVIAFLDDDAVAEPEWIERMAAAYGRDEVLAVGGAVEPHWAASPPGWFPEEFGWVVGCSYRGLPDRPERVRNVIGANMSFRRDVFDRVGGFRNGIGRLGAAPFGCEETELCIRATRDRPGAEVLYDPRVRVAHRVTGSRARFRYFLARCYAEGRSKALVASLVGHADALASERAYVTHVLPGGVLRGFGDAVIRRDPDGLRRSGAILLGLAATGAGYLHGAAANSLRARRPLY